MATHPATADPVHLHDDPFDDLTDEALADRLEAMLVRQRETTYTEPAVPITIRVPKPTIARYKARAKAAKVPYQTLINAVLARYLEEEETVVLPRINVTLDSAQLEQLRTNGIDVVLTAKTA